MAGTLTATVDAANARVLLRLTWAGVDEAIVWRVDGPGRQTPVRGAEPAHVSGIWVGYDYEMPLDVNVHYYATATGQTDQPHSAPVTVPSNNQTWLKHLGKPTLSQKVIVEQYPDLESNAPTSLLYPLGRRDPIAIGLMRHGVQGRLDLATLTDRQRTDLTELLADGSVLLLQAPAAYGLPNNSSMYVAITAATEERVHDWGAVPYRRWQLDFAQAARPEGVVQYNVDWQRVVDTYPTWQAVIDANPTWADLLDGLG